MAERAAIYARISDDPQGKAAGVKRQLADCRALAERRGFVVVGEFIDNDISAFNGKHRPEYERLRTAISAGAVDVIVCWDADRLYRRPKDLEGLLDLLDATPLQIATVTSGELAIATPAGRMIARQLVAVAGYESEHKAQRVARAMEQRAKDGKPFMGGIRPYGYDDDRVTIRKSEAKLIREAADRVLAGETGYSVARDFERRGVVSPAGLPWQAAGLRRMLVAPRLAGLRVHRGEVVATGAWKPIISPETHARLVIALERPAAPQKGGRRYLLSGILRCGKCGKGLAGRKRVDSPFVRYECYSGQPGRGGCGRLVVALAQTDALVVGSVLDTLAASSGLPSALRAVEDGLASETLDEIATLTARRNEMARERALGTIDAGEWRAARDAIDERLSILHASATLDTRTAALAKVQGLDRAQLEAAWAGLDLATKRAIITAVVGDEIVVSPSRTNRFDPDRIGIPRS
jgi:DNA invertase Pin-like site-specific DNA recombinase